MEKHVEKVENSFRFPKFSPSIRPGFPLFPKNRVENPKIMQKGFQIMSTYDGGSDMDSEERSGYAEQPESKGFRVVKSFQLLILRAAVTGHNRIGIAGKQAC